MKQIVSTNPAQTRSSLSPLAGAAVPAAKTADYTVLATDNVIVLDGTSATVTATLPAVADLTEPEVFTFICLDKTNAVVIDGNAAETINGAATYTFATAYDTIVIMLVNGEWVVVSEVLNA